MSTAKLHLSLAYNVAWQQSPDWLYNRIERRAASRFQRDYMHVRNTRDGNIRPPGVQSRGKTSASLLENVFHIVPLPVERLGHMYVAAWLPVCAAYPTGWRSLPWYSQVFIYRDHICPCELHGQTHEGICATAMHKNAVALRGQGWEDFRNSSSVQPDSRIYVFFRLFTLVFVGLL